MNTIIATRPARISKEKSWQVTVITITGRRTHFYFDTEEDADTAAAMLFAGQAVDCEIKLITD